MLQELLIILGVVFLLMAFNLWRKRKEIMENYHALKHSMMVAQDLKKK